MKIFILTMPLGENIGGILQAYSLQFFLKGRGHEVEIIDVVASTGKLKSFMQILSNRIRRAIGKTSEIQPTSRMKAEFYRNLRLFKVERLHLTRKIASFQDLRLLLQEHCPDTIIVGSDQVWRRDAALDLDSMFLNVSQVRKISYAASFGKSYVDYSTKDLVKIKRCLEDFSSISVREASGKDWLEQFVKIKAEVALDPVLLVGEHLFDRVVSHENCLIQGDYAVEYILDRSPEVSFLLGLIKNKINLSTQIIGARQNIYSTPIRNMKSSGYGRVEEWIAKIKHAKYVITDSYHGVLFSILYKKNFVVLANQYRGLTRLYEILGKLSLLDKIIYDYVQVDAAVSQEVDWISVHKKITLERAKSTMFFTDVEI